MKHLKRAAMFFSLFVTSSVLASCKETTIVNRVSDESTIIDILGYSLEYELDIPGTQISYNHMREGANTKNKFGPNFDEGNRLYTYLMDYRETEKYYFVYINKDEVKKRYLADWLDEYLDKRTEGNDCRFDPDNDKYVIDGRYVFVGKKEGVNDFIITSSNEIDQKYEINGHMMALYLEMKSVTVIQNVSTKKEINKTLPLLNKLPLKYDDSKGMFDKLSQQDYGETYANKTYPYVGKRLETYPTTLERKECLYSPIMGFDENKLYKTVKANIDGNKVLLPRMSNGYDLLMDEELPITEENVFGEYKKEFLNAFIECDGEDSSTTKYGYYI